MAEKYIIPQSIDEFQIGTAYEVRLLDNTWSSVRYVSKLCWSIKTDLRILMEEQRVRIIQDD